MSVYHLTITPQGSFGTLASFTGYLPVWNESGEITFAPPRNDISFTVGNQEILRLEEDGRIYVRGTLAATDRDVVSGMRDLVIGSRQV